ncbi:MAG TPA: type II secretion system protein [Pyrinomonadaceae bacterium]|nr:type II secretion system protein [Pyrinomonadaceae bacterium]
MHAVQGVSNSTRGDEMKAVQLSGRRVVMSVSNSMLKKRQCGFTLIELVITITVLTIMTMGVVPLLKLSVKRQKEQRLHDALREMRTSIDEFHRDTVGMNCTGTGTGTTGTGTGTGVTGTGGSTYVDPRSKVVISDCTVFGVDNPDRYPPDLDTLVSGVNVVPRGAANVGGRGLESTGTSSGNSDSVLGSQLSTKKKVYLRSIPIDPITGKAEWDLRSCYDSADSGSWGGENIFDVRSKSKDTALNGEKYSDW